MPNSDYAPNVLVMHVDQQRYDTLGCMGNPDVQTPNIDALAADGVRYDRCYCPYPVCTPSRYSTLSGLHVHQHAGWGNHCTLAPGIATFPKLLRAANYKTKAVGKMHFTPTYLDVGFDEMVLAEQNGDGRFDDDYHRYLREHGLVDAVDMIDQRQEYRKQAGEAYWKTYGAVRSNLPEEHHSTTWVGDRAAERIAAWEGDGNLLMTGFIKPHHPFDPPAPWDTMYDPDELTILPGWTEEVPEVDRQNPGYFRNQDLDQPTLRHVMAMYYATISQIDAQVGRWIKLLKELGLYDKTLIIYTSDHGDYLGYHHLLLKGNHLYEPLMRVPLIVKYPEQVGAGHVRNELVSGVDLAPTILRACRQAIPPAMAGTPLQDLVDRDYVFAVSQNAGLGYMVRSERYKLEIAAAAEPLFFDLENDPLELDNVAASADHQDAFSAHCEALTQWHLFETKSPVYLDPAAPLCPGDNVQPQQAGTHRQRMSDYLRQQLPQAAGDLWQGSIRPCH